MSKKVKVKQIRQVIGGSGVSDMLDELMGLKNAEASIIIPKFVSVRNDLNTIYRTLMQVATLKTIPIDFPKFVNGFEEIKKFATELKDSTCIKGAASDEEESMYANMSQDEINQLYKKLKDDIYMKQVIIMTNILKDYKSSYQGDKQNLNFVNRVPGLDFKIFPFSSLDLKLLWITIDEFPEEKRKQSKLYFLNVFASLLKRGMSIYKTVTSPDIDIDEFSEILISSIETLEKQPELSRCKMAFARIKDSVDMLKDNFGTYYAETVKSANPDTMITSFIMDVSNKGGNNAKLTSEFKKIISYMHKMSERSGKTKDPKVKQVFEMLNQNFKLMEENKAAKSNAKEEDKEDDEENKQDESLPKTDEEINQEKLSMRLAKQKAKKKKKAKAKKEKLLLNAGIKEADCNEEEFEYKTKKIKPRKDADELVAELANLQGNPDEILDGLVNKTLN